MNTSKATFEEILERDGRLVYTSVGNSMLPFIHSGKDVLVIEKPASRLKKYDVPLYRRDSGQYVLHRILKVREKDYVICGDNRWRRETGITDRHILGVLTAIVRDGTAISVQDPAYLRKVHLWCDFFWVRAAILWAKALPGRVRRKVRRWMGRT